MGRWAPDARERLESAAIELFEEQGFAATTVPQIAARARLTTRTFYRHFEDKREVLFGGDEMLTLAARLITDGPDDLDATQLIVRGLKTVAETRFEGRREDLRRRRAIVRSDDGVGERELRKNAVLSEATRQGLVDRGVAPGRAALLAATGVTVLGMALDTWLDQDGEQPSLFDTILDTFESLQTTCLEFTPALAEERAAS